MVSVREVDAERVWQTDRGRSGAFEVRIWGLIRESQIRVPSPY